MGDNGWIYQWKKVGNKRNISIMNEMGVYIEHIEIEGKGRT